jgi:hypothetical protein
MVLPVAGAARLPTRVRNALSYASGVPTRGEGQGAELIRLFQMTEMPSWQLSGYRLPVAAGFAGSLTRR